MATAVFTTVEARVDQQLTNAIWKDEIQDNLNALGGAHKSLLTNGGFEVWQRGAGGFTTDATYCADRWIIAKPGGATITVTQETSIVDDGSASSLKMVFTLSGSNNSITQKVENYAQLRNRTVSFSMRVRQGAASALQLFMNDGITTASTSSTSSTTGSYITLTVSQLISASATQLNLGVLLLASGTHYLDNAMLVVGPAPAPYQPLHPQEELSRCQRYYEVHGGVNTSMSFAGYNAASAVSAWYVPFATTKYGTPTMTKNGTWSVTNCGQPVTNSPYAAGYTFQATTTALGSMAFFANSTDDTVTAEINP